MMQIGTRKQSCEKKRKFHSHNAAHRAMVITRETHDILGMTAVYQCKHCGMFHWGHVFGSKPDRAQRVINAIDKAMERDRKITQTKMG